jgi:hypothetical protein
MSARFWGVLLGFSIHSDDAKLGAITAVPFEVIKSRPTEISSQINTGLQAVHHTAQRALDVFQAKWF